jgi:hypothetical protein
MKKKILTIGDIHGLENWKSKLFGNQLKFEHWKREIQSRSKDSLEEEYPLNDYHRIIFIGDYVDSFTISDDKILQNLRDIILLKREYPEKIILLIGNHDVQYIDNDHFCSGYRGTMRFDLHQTFNENLDLFQMAHYEEIPLLEGRRNRKVLWTHAGVTQGWLNDLDRSAFYNTKHRFYEILKDNQTDRIDQKLQLAWALRLTPIFAVDSYSGGSSSWAGPIWVRPHILSYENLTGIDQIVGHTPKSTIIKMMIPPKDVESNPENQDLLVLTDCLEHGDESYYEFSYDENENEKTNQSN